jgi:hypothetical protein
MIPFYLFFLISVCPLFDLSFPFPLMTLYWHRKSLLLGLSAIRSKNLYRQSGREHGRLSDTRLVFFGPVTSFLFAGHWKTRIRYTYVIMNKIKFFALVVFVLKIVSVYNVCQAVFWMRGY